MPVVARPLSTGVRWPWGWVTKAKIVDIPAEMESGCRPMLTLGENDRQIYTGSTLTITATDIRAASPVGAAVVITVYGV